MSDSSTDPYRFGDLLALARASWVAELTRRLAASGYPDYRRSDAAATRLLLVGPSAVGRVGEVLGVTRQAARKVVTALEERGYVTTARAEHDGRQLDCALTEHGIAYAAAVGAALRSLNAELCARVAPRDLVAADLVLRAAVLDGPRLAQAGAIAPPGGR